MPVHDDRAPPQGLLQHHTEVMRIRHVLADDDSVVLVPSTWTGNIRTNPQPEDEAECSTDVWAVPDRGRCSRGLAIHVLGYDYLTNMLNRAITF